MKLSKIDKLKIALNLEKKHSHDKENARRRRQIGRGIIKITVITSTLFITLPASASTTNLENPVFQLYSSMEQRVGAMAGSTSKFIISVEVELEDSHRSESYTEIMPGGSTASDVLEKHHKVTYGQICADPNGVLAVDGIGDFTQGNYWIVSVNGDYIHVNSHTKLKSGDQVKWQHLTKKD